MGLRPSIPLRNEVIHLDLGSHLGASRLFLDYLDTHGKSLFDAEIDLYGRSHTSTGVDTDLASVSPHSFDHPFEPYYVAEVTRGELSRPVDQFPNLISAKLCQIERACMLIRSKSVSGKQVPMRTFFSAVYLVVSQSQSQYARETSQALLADPNLPFQYLKSLNETRRFHILGI